MKNVSLLLRRTKKTWFFFPNLIAKRSYHFKTVILFLVELDLWIVTMAIFIPSYYLMTIIILSKTRDQK